MNQERLGNIATFINGAAFKPEDWNDEGLRIIRIQNLTNPNKPYNRTLRKVDDKYIVKKGDVLVSWSATIDVFIWENEEDALLNQHIFKVVFDFSKVEKRYFIFALKQTIDELTKFAHGSTMKHVVKKDFDNHKIFLPPLPDQIRIAEILSQAENLITQRKESILLLDELLKSTFLEMFGDPALNEKRWKIEIIQNLVFKPSMNGHYVPKEQYLPNGTEMVHMSDLFYNIVPRGKLKRVLIPEKEIEKYSITEFDLLIARRSLTFEGAAKACLIPKSDEPLVFESSMIKLSPDLTKILPIYLFYYLNNDRAKSNYILKHITKSTISGINQSNLNKVEVILPPLKLQNKFASIVEKVETLKTKYQASLKELENMYGLLSQKAFKGELKVKIENV
ncbi:MULTISPECIES: restriction endonuclease subunit S [unclassified Flavobacterium]|uniref:restriction endonuclease subunit S n=1 Tax=unclassified Flavobacterium TaxID=196869 RepID=UPI003F931C85